MSEKKEKPFRGTTPKGTFKWPHLIVPDTKYKPEGEYHVQLVLDEASKPTPFRHRRLFVAMIRYIAPILLLAILVSSILHALGVVVI
ncbi:MAG: hypothetical protein EOM68_27940 [Spirochaetia bacterium]|nr:hypothetical protein [Spirochaetia bacterium]